MATAISIVLIITALFMIVTVLLQSSDDDGIGALYERYEALKRKLSEMGMFAEEYKQPIPRYITRLGVVTAPTGAAVRDIITVSKRRNPGIQIILYPALVQGDGAAESIALGIRTLDRIGVDTIIAGRGGGSIEDLWAFNEEIVARAIFNCRTPLISAVGHETDTTIADFAADLRAPTPSAAAELAVDDMVQVQMSLRQSRIRLAMLMKQRADYERQKADQFRLKLRLNGPEGRLRDARQRLAHLQERIAMLVSSRVKEERHRADGLRQQLERLVTDKRKENRTRTEQLKERLSRDMAQRIRTEKHRLELALQKAGSPHCLRKPCWTGGMFTRRISRGKRFVPPRRLRKGSAFCSL